MTAAELRQWQRRCGFRRDADAAAAVGIAIATYRRQRTGRSPVGRQTELLCAYHEVFSIPWRALGEATERLTALTAVPLAPLIQDAVVGVIAKLGKTYT